MKSRPIIALLALVVLLLGVTPAARAEIHMVNQVGFTFDPPNLSIAVGDTVRWIWTGGDHTVTNGTGAADPNVGTLFDTALNSVSTEFEFQFNNVGVVPYFCRPHEFFNMKGTITVEQPAAPPTEFTIFGKDFEFIPSDLTIKVGDTVTWRWAGGFHTVTNGTGAVDPESGVLFDAPLNSIDTTFAFTFDSTGVYPYYCVPHELVNMVGTITVLDDVLDVGDPRRIATPLRAYPNPFARSVRLNFVLSKPQTGSVDVFDLAGRRVATVFSGRFDEGANEITWDGRTGSDERAAAGIYFVRLRTADRVASTKLYKSR